MVPQTEPLAGRFEIAGEVRAIKYNSMGQVNYDSGWQRNRITDAGLDTIGGLSQFSYPMRYSCYVGTSNAATTDNMIQLVSKIGNSVNYDQAFRGAWNNQAPNYDRWVQDGYRFAPGNGTGTLQEVGFHPNDEDKMFARHVMSPSITKAADETLDIYHRFGVYPTFGADQTGVVTFEGEDFNFTCRPWFLNQSDWSELRQLESMCGIDTFPSPKPYCVNTPLQDMYTNTVNWDTTGGYGTSDAYTTFYNTSPASGGAYGDDTPNGYVPGSYTANCYYLSGLDGGNLTAPSADGLGTGIRRVFLGGTWMDLQVQFYRVSDNYKVPKDETKTMQVDYSFTWARRP